MAKLTRVVKGESCVLPLDKGGWSGPEAEEDGVLVSLDAKEKNFGGVIIPMGELEEVLRDKNQKELLRKREVIISAVGDVSETVQLIMANIVEGNCKKESLVLLEDTLKTLSFIKRYLENLP
jgi:hypothetical protein